MRTLNILLALGALCPLGCSEEPEPVPVEPRAAEPAPEPPPEASAVVAADYRPVCLELDMQSFGAHQVPTELATLAVDAHEGSSLVLYFSRRGTVLATPAGHEPDGHVFRWTLREQIAEPRARFRNDVFRGRLAVMATGVTHQEGFENRQIRTLEARLRTQTERELVMTVLNSREEGRPSTATETCVDRGALPSLTVAHFAGWGWLPSELAPIASVAPQALVRSLRTGGSPQITLEAVEPAARAALADVDRVALVADPDGSVRLTPVFAD